MALTPDRRRDVELLVQAVFLLAVVIWFYDVHRRLEVAESAARNVEALEARLKTVEAFEARIKEVEALARGTENFTTYQSGQIGELRRELGALERNTRLPMRH